MNQFSKILFIQTAYLGDAILSIPVLKNLKLKYPHAQLAILVKKGLGELFLKSNLVDEVFEVDKKNSQSLGQSYLQTKTFNADLIISAHQSIRTAIWVARLKAAMAIGFLNWSTFWAYTHRVKRKIKDHDVLRQLSLLEPLNIGPLASELFVSVEDNLEYNNFSNYIAIAPGSQWATKRWELAGFIATIKRLQSEGSKVLLIGGKDEKLLGEEIKKEISDVENLIGKTSVYQLAQLLKKCKLLISNDSGAMHVAAAVGTPVVAIYGPTVPAQGYTPWIQKSKIVEVNLNCRPCGAHGHHKCPIKTHDCMKKITHEQVLAAASEIIC